MSSEASPTVPEPKPLEILRHEQQIWQGRFSPCGEYLLAAGYDALVHRWKIGGSEFTKISPVEGHHGWVQCLECGPGGEIAYSADSWGRLACWPYRDETPQPRWAHEQALPGWIRALAVSPDGAYLATAGNHRAVRIWSAADGRLVQELDGHPTDVFSVAFHPHEQALVTGDWFGTIRHWDLQTGRVARTFDAGALYRVDRMQDCGGVRVVAFDNSGKTLVCGGQKHPAGGIARGTPMVILFDWETAKRLQEFEVGEEKEGFVYAAQFHPQGFLMTASSEMPSSGRLWFWSPGDEKPFYINKEAANGRSLSLHPDGRLLAIVTSDSKNKNGRQIRNGVYAGGSARIYILRFPA